MASHEGKKEPQASVRLAGTGDGGGGLARSTGQSDFIV